MTAAAFIARSACRAAVPRRIGVKIRKRLALRGKIVEVMRAVSRGYRTMAAIAAVCDITPLRCGTYLTRLRHRGYVEARKVTKGRDHWKEYHAVGVRCLLADIWK